ncbi:aerobic C4-dicarboxylate transport protein [Rhabdobacter roseus]|uniref:Aerobic C4-dicarboxylate transport protein n=1 Tax=Rhabdobacter roseus TaxID=1655419 RepID=A0A840TYP9_9BACT|nr:dicarboxylate/amino acid:cation symporter [Rhabdobacter roseus]MBB5284769.1 aerobic C4-dicarboxylate transport protein [Rhabdobacter roseus]
MKKIYNNLTFRVLTAILLGILLGHFAPSTAAQMKPLGDVFINMIKMVIAPIIFLTIVLGISNMGDLKKVGRVGGKALLYFEIITTIALVIGLVVANLIRPGDGVVTTGLATSGSAEAVSRYAQQSAEMDWMDFFMHVVPSNAVGAFAEGDILQVLVFSVLFGMGLTRMGSSGQSLIRAFDRLSKVFFNILNIVMKLAPIGAFGGMAYTIGTYGLAALLPLGKLMITVYVTMFLFIFVVLNLVLRYYKISLWQLLKYIKEELLIVLGTSSSESVLPLIMDKLEHLGCSRSVVGLVIPAGYSFNLDGTTIYLSMAVVFLAQVFQVDLTLAQELTILGILMVTSKGAAGVTGSGFIVLASTLTAVKVIPLEGLALLLGVDRFMSEARAITNTIGNTVATVWLARNENELDMKRLRQVFNKEEIDPLANYDY